MRRLVGIIAAVSLFVSSGAAWAIYKESSITITEGGKPLPGATVSLTVKSPPVKKTARTKTTPPKVVEKKQEKTDRRGVLIFGFDDDKVPAGATVDLIVRTADGRRLTRTGVPLALLAAGGPINVLAVSRLAPTIPSGSTGTRPAIIASGSPSLVSTPVSPELVRQWIGLYAGFALGGSWANAEWTTTRLISLGIEDALVEAFKEMNAAVLAYQVYVGYLWLLGDEWVAGVEADLAYFDAKMDPGIPGTLGLPGAGANDSVTVRTSWNGSVRGRIGRFITPRVLAYVTGGLAWMRAEATVNCTTAGVCGTNGIPAFSQTNSETLTGWILGGGVEAQLAGNWRGRVEYRYSDYGTFSPSFGTPANLALDADIDLTGQSVMFGLSYALGGAM
jgi:outer membrane immunogenic protein